MFAAYTMFNVYLPKLLETRSPSSDPNGAPKSLENSLWDVVIYSLGGCPGAIVSLAHKHVRCDEVVYTDDYLPAWRVAY